MYFLSYADGAFDVWLDLRIMGYLSHPGKFRVLSHRSSGTCNVTKPLVPGVHELRARVSRNERVFELLSSHPFVGIFFF